MVIKMKYYGSIYKGFCGKYIVSELQEYSSPYDALKAANNEWNSDPEKQMARLLVVFRKSEGADEDPDMDAYFQFSDSKSCREFADKQCTIEWSMPENQKWNGNAKMMG